MMLAAHVHIVLPIAASKNGQGCCENVGDSAIEAAPTNTNKLAVHLKI